ncbi:hypothetical protein RHSIM_Rhsim04G0148100 [Rhododendron simsii]|uniref:Uncharacterized protein n=1 Tax=Rhododendron simsii TaxID=118357 RepID=A0A834HCT6_RHOSS|nr:hypothetical protein RHSIM_Rhsim04G0148100 [Rhododendron simsii]
MGAAPNRIWAQSELRVFTKSGVESKGELCVLPRKSVAEPMAANFHALDAFEAAESTNGTWIWGQELLVNIAKFLKKHDSYKTQIYNRHNPENLGDQDFSPRNRWRNGNQHFKIRSYVNNSNSSGYMKELEALSSAGYKPSCRLKSSAVRKNIRSQQFEASMSTDGEDIDSYIMDPQEQEQNTMDTEL